MFGGGLINIGIGLNSLLISGGGGPTQGSITGTPPLARLAVPYTYTFSTTGVGVPTLAGALPPGLTYNAGTISGTPS